MNCGNAFQIYLYLENRMSNRASYIGAQRECYRAERVMTFLCKDCRIFHCIDQLHKFLCSVSNDNVIVLPLRTLLLKIYTERLSQWQTYLVALIREKHRRRAPVSQCWNKRIPVVRIDRCMGKLQRTQESYQGNQNGRNLQSRQGS